MPVIIHSDSHGMWLNPEMEDVGAVSELLQPYPARLMNCYPVSTRINHAANDGEDCSKPVVLSGIQERLFS